MINAGFDLDGPVPPEWEIKHLGGEVRLKNGSAFKPSDWSSTGLPIVRIQNLKDRKAPFNYFQGDTESHVILEHGDLLFSWSGSRGTSFGPHIWWGEQAVLNQHIFKVTLNPTTQLDQAFLSYALLFLTAQIESHAYGLAALVHVRKGDLEATPVPIPPHEEQRKITAVLGLVQRRIEQQERLLELTTELKQGLVEKLTTEGTYGEPLKTTEIGTVPQSWRLAKLGELLSEPLRNGHSAKASNSSDGIRTLTLTAVTQRDFSEKNTKLTIAMPHRVEDLWLKPNDLLIERANTPEYVGLAALYEGREGFAIFPDLMIRARLDHTKVVPYFVAECLLTRASRQYFQRNARATTGNFPKIDQGTVENAPIPLPTMQEQSCISTVLRTVDRKAALHRQTASRLRELFQGLLHQLMTAQVRLHDVDLALLHIALTE